MPELPAVVVYLVDPFSGGQWEDDEVRRLATLGLLRCYQGMVAELQESGRSFNVQLQVSSGGGHWEKDYDRYLLVVKTDVGE